MTTQPLDQHVEAVRGKLARRAETGLKKYGVTTERTDLTTLDWLNHAQEEAMDMCVYLERLIRDEKARIAAENEPIGEKPAMFWQPGDRAWACATFVGETLRKPVVICAVDKKGILVQAEWDTYIRQQFDAEGRWRRDPSRNSTAWLEVRRDD